MKTKKDLIALKGEFSGELENLLSYWINETLDEQYGGFIGEIDHFGIKKERAAKGSIVNARILWTFSAAYRLSKKEAYKKIAERSFNYLIDNFWDKENGGLYWEVDYLGKPTNKRKQAYAQGFGIYAFSEYYRATENVESLNYSKELFNILEKHFWDTEHLGYVEAFNENWEPIDDMRLSDKDLNAPKTMNTHLHILEPYTNLFRVWPDQKLKQSIQNQIDLFCDKIIDPKTNHLKLFFKNDWTSISNEISFGHDIEGAWLLNEACMVINNHQLDENLSAKTIALVEATISEGMDIDSSIFYEKNGEKYDTDKHWWPQAEAMVGLLDAFQQNSDVKYIKHIVELWGFIKTKMIDTSKGEWFWRVDKKGVPYTNEVKVGFWKCPYHNGRALMELIERIEKIK